MCGMGVEIQLKLKVVAGSELKEVLAFFLGDCVLMACWEIWFGF